jgi:hypothetical protein
VGDTIKFLWNNICDIHDASDKSKMHGLDSILVYARHIEALLKTWALGQPLQPLDKRKCMMIANHIVTLNHLVFEIYDEFNGGICIELNFGKGIEAAVEAAEYLTKVTTDWEKANALQREKVQEHILLFIPALHALLDALEPSTKSTAASLLKRLLKDEEVIRQALPEELKTHYAEIGINPNSMQAKTALALAQQYAAELNKAMAGAND